jgi:hypothetical protein
MKIQDVDIYETCTYTLQSITSKYLLAFHITKPHRQVVELGGDLLPSNKSRNM